MPTYQYVCTTCANPHEAQQSFSDPTLTECPTCPGRLRKVFSAVGVVFKGSGFYRNDSRAPEASNGSAGKGSDATNKDAKADSSTKTDTSGASADAGEEARGSGSGSGAGADAGKATAGAGSPGRSSKPKPAGSAV
ncbi:zinc ribbon domain-containing protein [soil metagenome]